MEEGGVHLLQNFIPGNLSKVTRMPIYSAKLSDSPNEEQIYDQLKEQMPLIKKTLDSLEVA